MNTFLLALCPEWLIFLALPAENIPPLLIFFFWEKSLFRTLFHLLCPGVPVWRLPHSPPPSPPPLLPSSHISGIFLHNMQKMTKIGDTGGGGVEGKGSGDVGLLCGRGTKEKEDLFEYKMLGKVLRNQDVSAISNKRHDNDNATTCQSFCNLQKTKQFRPSLSQRSK